MPPRKQSPAPHENVRDERLDRLAGAVDDLAVDVYRLTAAIDDIRQELEDAVKVIRANFRASMTPPPIGASVPRSTIASDLPSKHEQSRLF